MLASTQKLETLEFVVNIDQSDIDNSDCRNANKCMIKVAIERMLRNKSGAANHHTRVDAGHAAFHWNGYRYTADMPKIGKANLIKFDMEDKARQRAARLGQPFTSAVKPFKLKIKARKLSKLTVNNAARKAQINAARKARIASGQKQLRYTLRDRITGFA